MSVVIICISACLNTWYEFLLLGYRARRVCNKAISTALYVFRPCFSGIDPAWTVAPLFYSTTYKFKLTTNRCGFIRIECSFSNTAIASDVVTLEGCFNLSVIGVQRPKAKLATHGDRNVKPLRYCRSPVILEVFIRSFYPASVQTRLSPPSERWHSKPSTDRIRHNLQ